MSQFPGQTQDGRYPPDYDFDHLRPQPTNGPGGQTRPPMQRDPATPDLTKVPRFTGFTPKYAMEGFDTAREQNIQKSAKDAFAYLSQQAPPPPTNDKAAMGVWFKTYIEPGMKQLGHNVTEVEGDKFRYNNWEGDFWVDFTRGAGAPGGALAWQADAAQGGPANQAYNHTQTAIMGVPQRQQPRVSVASAILSPVQPTASVAPDLGQYYQYLTQLMQGQEQI